MLTGGQSMMSDNYDHMQVHRHKTSEQSFQVRQFKTFFNLCKWRTFCIFFCLVVAGEFQTFGASTALHGPRQTSCSERRWWNSLRRVEKPCCIAMVPNTGQSLFSTFGLRRWSLGLMLSFDGLAFKMQGFSTSKRKSAPPGWRQDSFTGIVELDVVYRPGSCSSWESRCCAC